MNQYTCLLLQSFTFKKLVSFSILQKYWLCSFWWETIYFENQLSSMLRSHLLCVDIIFIGCLIKVY